MRPRDSFGDVARRAETFPGLAARYPACWRAQEIWDGILHWHEVNGTPLFGSP